MSPIFFWIACVFAIFCATAHTYGGRGLYLKPLENLDNLQELTRSLAYSAWYGTTLTFLVQAAAFGFVALYPQHLAIAIFATFHSAASSLMVIGVAASGHHIMFRMPAIYFFATIATLGALGIYTA